MNFFTIFIYSAILVVTILAQEDFCNTTLCPRGITHVACGNPRAFSSNCPKNAKMVNLRPYRAFIMKRHNDYRNKVASGTLGPYKAAARMATMRWSPELAKVAAFNVKQCHMQHDKCRNTRHYKVSGQNLAYIAIAVRNRQKKTRNIRWLLKNRMAAWYREWRNSTMDYINKFPKAFRELNISHFTALVNEKNTRGGCAAIRYRKRARRYFLLACNYAMNNVINRKIYTTSNQATSGCKTGRNPKYPNLCSTAEKYKLKK